MASPRPLVEKTFSNYSDRVCRQTSMTDRQLMILIDNEWQWKLTLDFDQLSKKKIKKTTTKTMIKCKRML